MGEPTSFLYPFIDAEERDAGGLLAELAASARTKAAESAALRTATLARCDEGLRRAADAMAHRFRHGGRLFTFGNGGSATDADATAELFRDPPAGRPLPALSLVEDTAVLTALANDVGFDLVFSRQIIAHARAGDIAFGFSTSGDSVDALRAFEESARRGLLTIGLSGNQGGSMAESGWIEHCVVVESASVHRVQETQDAIAFTLWRLVQSALKGHEP
jgi:D-sedoheptulose 7-phosphate isomerase